MALYSTRTNGRSTSKSKLVIAETLLVSVNCERSSRIWIDGHTALKGIAAAKRIGSYQLNIVVPGSRISLHRLWQCRGGTIAETPGMAKAAAAGST